MSKRAAPSSPPPQSVMPSAPQTPDRVSEESKPTLERGMSVAAFDGSFAPLVRPTVRREKPWYKDRDYFLAGWLSPAIWRAAVRRDPPPCPKKNKNAIAKTRRETPRSSKPSPPRAWHMHPSSPPPRSSATTRPG
ncbi:hypothetical protein J3458_004668 [Metarhizium acridum]|uniref:uncharacterized protein n=1 Tax=Metarhizium acridum TaxID=92637 RepID=UPI001C6BA427|nr:hypothetical protein J3458_004668 [Metarhizium acridum]